MLSLGGKRQRRLKLCHISFAPAAINAGAGTKRSTNGGAAKEGYGGGRGGGSTGAGSAAARRPHQAPSRVPPPPPPRVGEYMAASNAPAEGGASAAAPVEAAVCHLGADAERVPPLDCLPVSQPRPHLANHLQAGQAGQ